LCGILVSPGNAIRVEANSCEGVRRDGNAA
jgi:hypothetical protein